MSKQLLRRIAVLPLVLALLGCPPDQPPDTPLPEFPGIKVINMVPRTLSGETNQDSEPFLAVHPTNADQMSASAFTPNPGGEVSGTAPMYVTEDGGDTWRLQNIVPSELITGDITHAFDSNSGDLYSGILRRPGGLLLNALLTNDFLSPMTMTVQNERTGVDQPFIQATGGNANTDRVYVGNNDFGVQPQTATVDVSLNGGTTYTPVRIESRSTSGQDGPSVRPALASDGTVYVAYFGWRTFSGGVASSDVVVVRDDNGGAGSNPFTDLVGTDGLAGRRVVQGVSIPFSNAPTLGQERIGSTLSMAVDPSNSDNVYVAWADRVGNGDIYTVHVRSSTDRGVTWSNNDLRTITNATNVAVAVANNGTVGLLYQQVMGTGGSSRWETHFEQSTDGFATVGQDAVLATVPANSPSVQFLPYLGDYAFALFAGSEFRGVFSANNTPSTTNFPQGVVYQRVADFTNGTLDDGSGQNVAVSIDPFYFSVPVLQGP